MTAFTDYITPETIASIRAKMKGYAVAAQLLVTDWIAGGVSQQILEAVDQALYNTAQSVSALVRGYASLDTSTDPHDPDPYDPTNATLPAGPGFLSAKGEGDYGTPRQDASFATGTFTIVNGSGGLITFLPGRVTFTRSTNFTGETFAPTYVNAPDPSIYTNPDGSVSINNGASLDIPVSAQVQGTGSNATAGQLSIVTVIAIGVTGANAASVLATDRQAPDDYRAACREAAALTSPNGPGDAYRYLAVTARSDGTYGDSKTGDALGVTRVYVSQISTTGAVGVYLATPTGAPISGTVTTIRTLITLSPAVVATPTAITITVNGAANTTIAFTYSVKIPASKVPGGATVGTYTSLGSPPANIVAIFDAIAAQEAAYLASVDIGGVDQTSGAGVIYTQDLRDNIVQATIGNVQLGLYNPSVSAPAGATTAVALGHVAILGAVSGTLFVV